MIRGKLRFQESISIVTDIIAIFVSYVLAVYIRYDIMESKPGLDTLSTPYLLIALAYSIIIASILGFARQSGRTGFRFGMEYGLFAVNAVGCLFLLAFLYTIGEQYFSRWALVLFWLISSGLLVLKNIILTLVFNRKQRMLSRKTRVVVIGSGRNCGDYIRAVGYEDACDFTIVGYIGEKSRIFFDRRFAGEEPKDRSWVCADRKGTPVNTDEIDCGGWLGGYPEAEAVLKRTLPDEAVFALEDGELGRLEEILPVVKKLGIKSCLVPGFGRYIPADAAVSQIDELKVIDLEEGNGKKTNGIYGLGLTLSIVFLILMLVIKRFHIGNAGSLGLYEAYRCFIFAMAGYFLFFLLQRAMKEKRCGNMIVALGSALACTVAIVVYELVYTQGVKLARDIGLDLKLTLAVIAACCIVKTVVDYVSRDDYPILM